MTKNHKIPKKVEKLKVLVFGASGMLGSSMVRLISQSDNIEVFGTVRHCDTKFFKKFFSSAKIFDGIDINDSNQVERIFELVRPDVVINCIGLVKQLLDASGPKNGILLNALFPHSLASLSNSFGSRLIHISTDCVFDGSSGNYSEGDTPNSTDHYGLSKLLGEVTYGNHLTIRTSIIGHEINSKNGLLEWFLAQKQPIQGFTKAIFSGFPTVELSTIIQDVIIPNQHLKGLFHISAAPISKYDLLNLIGEVYGHKISIKPSDELAIDRSLNSSLFKKSTGYTAPSWKQLIKKMKDFN